MPKKRGQYIKGESKVDPFYPHRSFSHKDAKTRYETVHDVFPSFALLSRLRRDASPRTAKDDYDISQEKLRALGRPSTPDSKTYGRGDAVSIPRKPGGKSVSKTLTVTREQAIRAAQEQAQSSAKRMEKEKNKGKAPQEFSKGAKRQRYTEGNEIT